MTVEVTPELLEQYMRASLEHVNDLTASRSKSLHGDNVVPGGFISDDGFDYLLAALDVAKLFLELWYDTDVARCQAIFDTQGVFVANYAELPPMIDDLDIPANEWGEDELEGYDGPPPEEIRVPVLDKKPNFIPGTLMRKTHQ